MKNRRFIAGATCPECGQLDTVYIYQQQGEHWRACARCDFRQARSELDQPPRPPEELPTRVNQHRVGEQALAHEVPVEKVTLLVADRSGNTGAGI